MFCNLSVVLLLPGQLVGLLFPALLLEGDDGREEVITSRATPACPAFPMQVTANCKLAQALQRLHI